MFEQFKGFMSFEYPDHFICKECNTSYSSLQTEGYCPFCGSKKEKTLYRNTLNQEAQYGQIHPEAYKDMH